MRKIILLVVALATLALGGCAGAITTALTPTSGDPAQGIYTLNYLTRFDAWDRGEDFPQYVTYQRCAWISGFVGENRITPSFPGRFTPRLLKGCIALEGFYRDLVAGRGGYCQGAKPTDKYIDFYKGEGKVGVMAVHDAAWQCISAQKVVSGGGFRDLRYVGGDYDRLCGTALNPPDNEYHSVPANEGDACQAALGLPVPGAAAKGYRFIGGWVPTSYIWHYVFTGVQDQSEAKSLDAQGCFGSCRPKSSWPVLSASLREHLQEDYAQMLKNHPLN